VREGEDILAELDGWAIATLRQHRLVWSGWGSAISLPESHGRVNNSGWGFRTVSGVDHHKLRLFFLSLLWRAAATTRREFSEVTLPDADLDILRRMLVDGNSAPLEFYPVSLTQLSTRGRPHNLVPLAQEKPVPNLPGLGHQVYPIFRFYFDGLVAHIHRQASGNIRQFGPIIIGNGNDLFVTTLPYEHSWELQNLRHVIHESLPRR
jgi:hypothetical protein